MPALLVHLAISNEYIKRHPEEIKDVEAFRKGSISPDLDEKFEKILEKSEKFVSHYYHEGDDNETDYDRFFNNPKVDMSDDFWKGYYLHLLTDETFYTDSFKEEYTCAYSEGPHLYTDYQNLGKWLLKKYHIDKSENFFTKRVLFLSQPTSGKTQYIKKRKLKKFIKKMSKAKIEA